MSAHRDSPDDIHSAVENGNTVSAYFTTFHKAGLQEEAVRVLEQLTHNAVMESRFNDAGYYYWKLSMQCLDIAGDEPDKKDEMLKKFKTFQRKAEMYYVYHSIQRYVDEPFTSHLPEALFGMARYLLHCMIGNIPNGISKVGTLYALAKQSKNLGGYKLARVAFERLQGLRVPGRYQEAVDLGSVTIRSKPFHDSEDLLPMCYRCSTTNPLLNNQGSFCINCRQPFVYSFVSFEVLPLVEFFVDEDITDAEALQLLEQEPPKPSGQKDKWDESRTSQGQALRIDNGIMAEQDESGDPFSVRLLSFDPGSSDFQPVHADREVLRSISRTEVIICEWTKPLRNQYFKSLMPDVSITKCTSCNKLFHTDDYELLVLQKGHCPYCRHSVDE